MWQVFTCVYLRWNFKSVGQSKWSTEDLSVKHNYSCNLQQTVCWKKRNGQVSLMKNEGSKKCSHFVSWNIFAAITVEVWSLVMSWGETCRNKYWSFLKLQNFAALLSFHSIGTAVAWAKGPSMWLTFKGSTMVPRGRLTSSARTFVQSAMPNPWPGLFIAQIRQSEEAFFFVLVVGANPQLHTGESNSTHPFAYISFLNISRVFA